MFTIPKKIRLPGPAKFDMPPAQRWTVAILKFIAKKGNQFFNWCESIPNDVIGQIVGFIFGILVGHLIPATLWFIISNDGSVGHIPRSFGYCYAQSLLWTLGVVLWLLKWLGIIGLIGWIAIKIIARFRRWCSEYSK